MNTSKIRLAWVLVGVPLLLSLFAQTGKTNVLVLTGGHSFPRAAFLSLFQDNRDVSYTHVDNIDDSKPFEDIADWPYDVIVMHNMGREISEKRKKNFLNLLEQGVGIVALHHVVAAWPKWHDFINVLGVRYYLDTVVAQGVTYPKSGFISGAQFNVQVKDTNHPITKGISDFTITDELFTDMVFQGDNHVLLTANHPEVKGAPLAWVKTYAKSRIFTLIPGHEAATLTSPPYKRIVTAAIRWTGDKQAMGLHIGTPAALLKTQADPVVMPGWGKYWFSFRDGKYYDLRGAVSTNANLNIF